MISRDLRVPVPIFVKKYFEGEYGTDECGRVFADKASVLGKVVNAMLVDFPHEIEARRVSGNCLTIRYVYRSKTSCIPTWKIDHLAMLLREIFDSALIIEARTLHENTGRYDRAVGAFLARYGIEVDVDIQQDAARSIYRNYLVRIEKKRADAHYKEKKLA